MRKMVLIGGGAVAAVVAVAVILIVFVFSSLDGLVKKAIETVGSQVAGVPVTVSAVKIDVTGGKASIKGLVVGNPKGFASPRAFALGEISVALDASSVTGNPIVIKDISVSSPEVTVEMGAQGSNLDALKRNIAGKGGASSSAPSSGDSGSDKKMVIDRLALTGGSVVLATPIPGAKTSAKLGDIVLTGIGRKSGGASATQVAETVLDALVNSSLKAVQSMGIGGLVDGAAGSVSGAAGALTGVLGK